MITRPTVVNVKGKTSSGINASKFSKRRVFILFIDRIKLYYNEFYGGSLSIRTDFHAIVVNCKSPVYILDLFFQKLY